MCNCTSEVWSFGPPGMTKMNLRHCEPTGRRKAPPDDRLREAIHATSSRESRARIRVGIPSPGRENYILDKYVRSNAWALAYFRPQWPSLKMGVAQLGDHKPRIAATTLFARS